MQFFTVILTFVYIIKLYSNSIEAVTDSEWSAYKKQYEKVYPTNFDDFVRREFYQDSIDEVNEFNSKQTLTLGYKIGLNQFSDLTKGELGRLGGTRTSANISNAPKAEQFLNNILKSNLNVPNSIDWRKQGNRVSQVKNQGKCRSSWAFVATGVLEGQIVGRTNSKNLVELSEQNLIDCVPGNSGCNVGLVEPSFWYAQNNGIHSELAYNKNLNYTKSTCKQLSSSQSIIIDRGYAILPEADENILKIVVARYGPVAAIIPWNENFPKYKSGIYYQNNELNKVECKIKRNHAILIVGYGNDVIGGDYWIVKNSYGKNWGENGYIRMARNKKNNNGIACNAMIAIF